MRVLTMVMAFGAVLVAARPAAGQPAGQSGSSMADPGPSRSFFGPTGRLPAPGHGYVALLGLGPFTQVGVTDWFSVGAGMPLLFVGHAAPAFVTPKVRLVRAGSTSVAAGVVHLFGLDTDGAGAAYVASTHGGAAGGVTLGAMWGYGGGDRTGPVFFVGGDHRLGSRGSMLVEAWVVPDGGLIVLGGVRRDVGRRGYVDLGLVAALTGYPAAGPVVGFGVRF